MKNLKKRLYKSKSKSKIFITILCIFGLLFSWSCSCKNRVSDPNETPINGGITNKKPDETPAGTFSMSTSTDNVTDNFIVKSASTVGEIKIAFVSANNYAYTSSYEVVDNDTTEANRITTAETTYANNVLTIKDTALAKVRQLYSSAGPAEKTITINFTFKANDASLKNNTQTLSVEVILTKAQELNTTEAKKNKIEEIFKAISQLEPVTGYNFDFTDSQTTTFTDLKVETKNKSSKGGVDGHSLTIDEFKKELLDNPPYGFHQEAVKRLDYISSVKLDESQEQGKVNGTIATFYVVISFNQKYETEDITFQMDVDAKGNSVYGEWDTTQNP